MLLDFNRLRDMLCDLNAKVLPLDDGKYMQVSGENISIDDIIYAADNIEGMEDIENYIINESKDFPAYDSVVIDDMDNCSSKRLNEKRRGCCPPKGKFRLNEQLKAMDSKDQTKLDNIERSVKDILDELNGTTIGSSEVRNAFKKLKAENKKLNRINRTSTKTFGLYDIPGAKSAVKNFKKVDVEKADEYKEFEKELSEKVNSHLASNKKYLHENVRINGKLLKNMSIYEIKRLYNRVLAEKKELTKKLINTKLNESINPNIKNMLNTKNKLFAFLDEEFTYRVARQCYIMNESQLLEDDEISDEELANLFGPAQGEENDKKEKSSKDSSEKSSEEDVEEVELSRIEITLKTQEDAEDLKDACIEEGIPEEAIQIGEEEDSATEEDESDEESDEESNEESDESTDDENDEDANESLRYNNIAKLLFEGEELSEEESDENEDESDEENNEEENEEDSEEDEDEEESDDSESVKFILVDTDYAPQLAKVLEDQYGISKEEFEEMIGGEIVEEDEEDDEDSATEDDEESSEEESDKKSDKKKKDKKEEEIDPNDLFAGL